MPWGRKPPPQPPPQPERPVHPFAWIVQSQDPLGTMLQIKGTYGGGDGNRVMHLGATNTHWMVTARNGHSLVLAPPQSHAGKTSSVMIPLILSTFGRVVSTSTKPDIVRATALVRAQHGRVWCYAPDGQTPIPPGLHELRWSPLNGAEDWSTAIQTAQDIVKTMKESGGRGEEAHWRERARDTLAPVFHWAAVYHKTLRQARDAVLELNTKTDDPVHPGKQASLGYLIVRELQKHRDADNAASAVLNSVISTSERELAGILSTAARALQVYQLPEAIASTENPNFDPAAFVRGDYGRSTVYIMSSSEKQEITAPLVVAFLNQVRQAQYRQQRQFMHEEMTRRRQEEGEVGSAAWVQGLAEDLNRQTRASSTTVFALDEIANIAPIPERDFTSLLSEGGSQGVLVTAAVQDLALVKDRWSTAGEASPTLFQDVLAFPGIRHEPTVELISKLCGEFDREMPSTGTTSNAMGVMSYSQSTSIHRQRRVPPDTVIQASRRTATRTW